MSLEGQIHEVWKMFESGKKASDIPAAYIQAVESVIEDLDHGKIRVASRSGDEWTVNEWVKKAILLFIRIQKVSPMSAGDFNFADKVPVKKWTGQEGVRVVPPAFVRKGAFIEAGAILMPSYVNIGAYVGSGTMVDTWATVGSCAQVGKDVHISGGVGIGGVLEPLQASPVIIEDHVFLGSRCIIVEGVRIGEGAVIGAGVTITASTKIIDVTGEKSVTTSGFVPPNSVVIPGTQEKAFPAGRFGVPCALIIGKRKPSTDLKTSLNQALRDFQL
jgi:2,3,4,5-tetrahydropyridine-2-carboxylate N-succinyltransferase